MTGHARFVPKGERVIVSIKPHPLFIVLVPLGAVLLSIVLVWAGLWATSLAGLTLRTGLVWTLLVLLIVLRLLWQTLEWLARSYVLTEKRVIRLGGVLRRYGADLPLTRLQHVTMFQSIRERIFGLGTIGFSTAGTGGSEAYWIMVARPRELLQTVRDAVAGTSKPMPTIGLAGAIGAGKSTVARILADLGCVVSDSDAAAKAALDRDDVKKQLVEAFGQDVIGADGRVDRRTLADLIFDDEEARRRLEALTHPIVGDERRAERARAQGARAFVIDAPLLFEAGVDDECDVVIFVDAPRPARLSRVQQTRGWTEEEVERREQAQMPLESKRERADHVVVNDADEAALARRVERLLERIEQDHEPGTSPT